MASSESLKVRAARPGGRGILAAETMVDLDQQMEASAAALEPADTEARLSWRENLQNRPLGLAGLLDARGQVDLQNIVPVLHDAEARKAYGKKGISIGGYVSAQQHPTYEQMTAGRRSEEVAKYVQRGIPRERVQDPTRPMVLLPNYLPTTGVDVEQETGDINEMYRAYNRSQDLPAHEGFHRLLSNTESVWSPEQRTEIKFQIPFIKKYNWSLVEHMFLGGMEFNRAPEALKKDPRFKAFTDGVIVGHFNRIAKVSRKQGKNREAARRFIDDPDVRSYFHFKGDVAEKPKDKYYELVEERYNKMVDILPPPEDALPPEDAQPSASEEEKSWWQRLIGKNKGGYVMTGAETMLGLD